MKILFVLEYYAPHIGGAEYLFQNICERLAKRGHTITVLTSQVEGAPTQEVLSGVHIKRIKVPQRFARYAFTLLAIPKAIKLAKQADIIHTTTYNAAFPARVAAFLAKKEIVLTVHEVWVGKWSEYTTMPAWKSFFHECYEKIIYKLKFSRYVGVSRFTRYELLRIGVHPKHTNIVLNGLDYAYWNPEKYDGNPIRKKLGITNEFVVFAYGRPGTSKGFDVLAQSIPKIITTIPDAKIVLVLSKSVAYEKEYAILSDVAKQYEQVLLLDPLPFDQLPNYIKMADCVVIPSRSEGFGYSCVQACALKRPVVASNIASLPEVISGKGKLFEVGNPDALAQAVLDIKQGNADEFGEKVFSWKQTLDGYEEVYKELL